ncbi:MAG: 2-dehydropantoate 2-reductase [Chloroflexi bacterium]|nr:2-dehydropantoate 2-reductase [Chloroflexota bacterium]
MQVLVMGAGAIGSVAGGLLSRAGHRVSLVGREPHMSAVRQQGLTISGALGQYHIAGLAACTQVGELSGASHDLLLLSTKAYDTESALVQALPLLGRDGLVVSLQNGIGNVETIVSQAGDGRAVGGRVMYGAEITAPGKVHVTTLGGELVLGSPGRSIPLARIEALAGAFRDAGLPACASENITAFLWGKLFYNCCLNPLSAMLGVPYGKLGENESTRAIMSEVIREVFDVARGLGQTLLWATPEEYEGVLFEDLIPRTAAHFASMYSDLRHGKRTEIDALNGAVWRLARQQGLLTPTNACLTLMIKAREKLVAPGL